MPHYYFDSNERTFTPDSDGLELDDIAAAKRDAITGLLDSAREKFSDSDRCDLVIYVRDEAGHTILRAKLSLVVDDMSG